MGWDNVAEAMVALPVVRSHPSPVPAPPMHQMGARACLASRVAWKPKELDFLRQMAAQRAKPTERQRDWLDGLFDRAMAHNREARQC
jgi:hypothetical protein